MSGLVSVLVVPEVGDAREMAVEPQQLPTLVRGGFRELVEPGDAVFEYDTRKLLFRDDRLRARDTVSEPEHSSRLESVGPSASETISSTTSHASTAGQAANVDVNELLKMMGAREAANAAREAASAARVDKLVDLMMTHFAGQPRPELTRSAGGEGALAALQQKPNDVAWTSSLVQKLGQVVVACGSHAFRQTIKETLK